MHHSVVSALQKYTLMENISHGNKQKKMSGEKNDGSEKQYRIDIAYRSNIQTRRNVWCAEAMNRRKQKRTILNLQEVQVYEWFEYRWVNIVEIPLVLTNAVRPLRWTKSCTRLQCFFRMLLYVCEIVYTGFRLNVKMMPIEHRMFEAIVCVQVLQGSWLVPELWQSLRSQYWHFQFKMKNAISWKLYRSIVPLTILFSLLQSGCLSCINCLVWIAAKRIPWLFLISSTCRNAICAHSLPLSSSLLSYFCHWFKPKFAKTLILFGVELWPSSIRSIGIDSIREYDIVHITHLCSFVWKNVIRNSKQLPFNWMIFSFTSNQ